MEAIEKIAADNGSLLITGTGANTGLSRTSMYVREDTVISVLTGVNDSGAAVDFKVTLGINSNTLKQGDFFPVLNGFKITAITLTSGSVILY